MSTVPRRVGEFVGEFEFWPLEADPEALTIAQHRPPGYFECDDIFVPSAKALVERGLQRAVAEWQEWEARHPEAHLFQHQRFLRLPDNFNLLPGPGDKEYDQGKEDKENEHAGGAGGQRKRKAPGDGEEEQEQQQQGMETDAGPTGQSDAAAKATGATVSFWAAAAASSASQQEQQQEEQQEQEPKEPEDPATARVREGGAVGGFPGLPPPPPRRGVAPWEQALLEMEARGGAAAAAAAGAAAQRTRQVERAAQLAPDAATLRGFLRHMPNFAMAHRGLKARMRDSVLALCKWKKACEGEDASGMKDYKTLPFLRRGLNVIIPPDRPTTAAEAGPFAIGEEETLVVASMFVPQNWTVQHYQDYTLLARNTLEHLHMVMYCTMSSILAVEGRAGHLPPEITRPNLAFFFIERVFYVSERGEEQPDYLDAIIEWLDDPQQERRAQLGIPTHAPLEIKEMAATTMGDLTLRVGTRYLYCHLGDCEHNFIISDLRLPAAEDDRDARLYPMLTYQKHYRKRRCCICDARPGQYVAIRDPLGDETRGIYCEFCHFQLHYDKEGNLLHEGFQVFPYLHDD